MKNKIIIFTIIITIVVSIFSIAVSAEVHDLELVGMKTDTLKAGEYTIRTTEHFIHDVTNTQEVEAWMSLTSTENTIADVKPATLKIYDNNNNLIESHTIKGFYSVRMNCSIDGATFDNYISTQFVKTDGDIAYQIDTGKIDGENVDNLSTENTIKVFIALERKVHRKVFDWFIYNTDYAEVNSSLECDGSTCPATDANFDNVCDDCGSVLTMSLRNTLYDYAKNLAESKANDGYPYYAIFKWNDTYVVHVSKQPMTSPDGNTLSGDGIMYNKVTQSDDGVNGGSGWTNGFYSTYDEFVEANHTISNFKGALPLAEKILGVTEEQLTETLPILAGTLMTLMVCGVGCLALLVVLNLFGKRSLIFRK